MPEGKVPLFYYPNDVIQGRTLLFFSQQAAQEAYAQEYLKTDGRRRNNKEASLPPLPAVTELNAVIGKLQSNYSNDKEELALVELVPPKDSARRAQQCQRQQMRGAQNFVVGQRNLVL